MMSGAIRFVLLIVLTHVFAYGGPILTENLEYENQKIKEMRYVMQNTSYCALIQDQNVSVLPLPYTQETDTDKYNKLLYTSKVLETFKGEKLITLTYEYIVEANGVPELSTEPYITCLCKKHGSYYVPDIIRFDYDGTEKYLEKARSIKDVGDKALLYCDE